jgi:hypothetical protein
VGQSVLLDRTALDARDTGVPHRRPVLRLCLSPRLGGHIGIGLVGRGELLKWNAAGLARLLRDEALAWLCEDMPPVASMTRGASGVTSVQWAVPGHAALVGDASIARDSLSSQGLAASMSDALYAVAAIMSGNMDCLRDRQEANLAAHLTYLNELVMQCRHRDGSLWTAYAKFIAANIKSAQRAAPALRHGRLEMNFNN